MADQAGPLAGLTTQDQKLIMGAFKSLRNGFEVDYSKLAQNMDWFTKDDATKPNVRKANNAWLVTRKKLFPDGIPAGAAPEGGAAKTKAPATPRKKKDTDAPKGSNIKKSPAKKSGDETNEHEAATGHVTSTNGVPDETAATGPAKDTDSEVQETGEADVKGADKPAADQQKVSDADANTPMKDSSVRKPTEIAPITPTAVDSVANDMSAGSMSPTPASAKAKTAPTTPKPKDAPKVQKTTTSGVAAKVAEVPLPATPVTPAPKATPKKRKTKAEKEAEAAAAASSEGGDEDDVDGKPPAKKRKSIDGKKNEGDDKAGDAGNDGGQSSAKPTPVKTPRKPSAAQIAKKEAREKEKAEKQAAKEKEKEDKKKEKERVKAEKAAAKKTPTKKTAKAAPVTDGESESSKPKTPRKPSDAQQAKQADNHQAEHEAEDNEAADAEGQRLALAAQEEINKKANEVFNGARIDKPAQADTADNDDEEMTANDHATTPKTNGFIAINGTISPAGSATASETAKAALDAMPGDVAEGNTIAVQLEEAAADTIVVGDEA